MRKIILLLCLSAFLLSLAACGNAPATTQPGQTTANPDEPPIPTPAPTEPKPTVQIGDRMDVPEAAATFEDVIQHEVFRVEIVDSYDDHFIYAWEYSFATDTAVVYIYDEYEGEEIVNVVKRDKATRYFRLIGQEEFVLDREADEGTWQEDKDVFTSMMQTLTQYSLPIEHNRYKKLEDVTAAAGDACAYDIYTAGVPNGHLCIDKATGILSALFNNEGNAIALITAISTEEAKIPKYK